MTTPTAQRIADAYIHARSSNLGFEVLGEELDEITAMLDRASKGRESFGEYEISAWKPLQFKVTDTKKVHGATVEWVQTVTRTTTDNQIGVTVRCSVTQPDGQADSIYQVEWTVRAPNYREGEWADTLDLDKGLRPPTPVLQHVTHTTSLIKQAAIRGVLL